MGNQLNQAKALGFLFGIVLGGLWPKNAAAQGYYFYDRGHYDKPLVWELQGGIGMLNTITDLQGSLSGKENWLSGVTFRNTNLAGSIGLVATLKDAVAFRLEYQFGRVEAYDSILQQSSDPFTAGKAARNLEFQSVIREVSITTELHPLAMLSSGNNPIYPFSPYLSIGVGYFRFDPTANLNGRTVRLHPLSLEGQGFDEYPDRPQYRLGAWSMPVGLGVKYEASARWNFRLEVQRRSTSTDYLDNVKEATWADPALFASYLSPGEAAQALQFYNKSYPETPVGRPKTRGISEANDMFWGIQLKIGLVLNRPGTGF